MNTTAPVATVYRERNELKSRPGAQARFYYSYELSTRPGRVDYGTALSSLRALLKRKGFTVVETFTTPQSKR